MRRSLARATFARATGPLTLLVLALPATAAAGAQEAAFPLPLLGSSETLPAEANAPAAVGPALPGGSKGTGTLLHFGGLPELPDLGELGEQLRFVGVPLPDGTTVDLDMTRLEPAGLGFGLYVDGQPRPELLGKLGLDLYVGTVVGSKQSSAALSFSKFGSRGWIQREADLFHLLAQPGPNGNWKQSSSQMVSDATLVAWGNQPQPPCEIGSLPPIQPPLFEQVKQGGGQIALSNDLYECTVAVETDDQLFQVFNDLNAEATYVTTLLAWISYRYEEQIQTVLTYPYVMFYTQGNDPWTSQETGGNTVSLLLEFEAAWGFNVPNNAVLGAFLSGAPLGGGVAWQPGLCSPPYNFSVSSHIAGTVQFPVVQQGGNWDFIVAAHEIGHNFFAPHTHEWCPTPLDECAPMGSWGQCQNQQVCTSMGTLMSYCHLCSPGTANITTYFHDTDSAYMRAWVEVICLPLYARSPEIYCTAKVNSQGCTPAIDASGHPTLSGLDNFHLTASNLVNQQDGLLFFGPSKASKPFQGGTKCVAAPTWRTQVQNSGGSLPGALDCSGSFDTQLSHLLFAAKGLGPGTTLFAQYWSLDPPASFGTNLTDAIKFHLVP